MKGKSCLTKLIVLYDEITVLVEHGYKVDVLPRIKAFGTVSHSTLTDKLMKC